MNITEILAKAAAGQPLTEAEQQELQRHLDAEASAQLDARIDRAVEQRMARIPQLGQRVVEDAAASGTAASGTPANGAPADGERSLTPNGYSAFLRGLRQGRSVEDLQAAGLAMSVADLRARGLNGLSDEDGGVLIAPQHIPEIERYINEYGVARQECTVIPTNARVLNFKSRTTGMTAYWVGEGEETTASKPQYANEQMTVKSLATLSDPISVDLIDDAMTDMMQEIGIEAAEAIAYGEDNAVFNGTTPFTGVLKRADVVTKQLQGNVDDIGYESINQLLYAVPSSRLTGAKFYMHRTIFERIMKVTDGDGAPLFRSGTNGDPNTFMGYPYRLVESMPAAGSIASGDSFIVFGNLRNIKLYDRKSISISLFREATVGGVNLATSRQVMVQHVERLGIIVRRPGALVRLARA